jgi:feruloyl esterase
VAGVIRPTADSEIGFEVWLPEQWNGRYYQSGSGGFAGAILYVGLAQGLRHGFAVASTDTGHTGDGAVWALGHPEKVIDYGYRAVHLTSVVGKAVIAAYYRRPPAYNYFSGCSNGGRESLMEAQRYPDDFDGWIVGAPANNFSSLMVHFLHASQVVDALEDPLTPSQVEALSEAALNRCDSKDGVKDGVIDAPLQCQFDPEGLMCKAAPDGICLSRDQISAVQELYEGPRDRETRMPLAPGFRGSLGAEAGQGQWQEWVTGPLEKWWEDIGAYVSESQYFSEQFFAFMVYADPALDFRSLDLLQASADGRSRTGWMLNSMDPDLSAVRAAGKKIIQYHGWADAAIPAEYSIAYYEAVEEYLGGDNRDFYRLFMVPGMAHCFGGPGPNKFGAAYSPGGPFDAERNVIAALMEWVEKGLAPERIVATKYQDDDVTKPVLRTRPLCVYPQVAKSTGRGRMDDAASFVCMDER